MGSGGEDVGRLSWRILDRLPPRSPRAPGSIGTPRLALLRTGEIAEFAVSRPGGTLTLRAEMAEREPATHMIPASPPSLRFKAMKRPRLQRWCIRRWRLGRMNQIIRELKRLVAGEKLEPEQLRGLIRAGYVYRNGDEHLLTDEGRDALARSGVQTGVPQ
jgi:hypothetical protein